MKTDILILEENYTASRNLQTILEHWEYRATAIANSKELTIFEVAKLKPNLILIDLESIEAIDFGTVETISQQFEIPIVFIVSNSDIKNLSRLNTNFYRYINKPFTSEELRDAIAMALDKDRQQLQLLQNARWLKTVLNYTNDGIITANLQGEITFINSAAELLLHLSVDRVLGKQISDVFMLQDAVSGSAIENPATQVLLSKKIFHLPQDVQSIGANGTEIFISGCVAPIIDCQDNFCSDNPNLNLSGTVMIFRDITETKLAAYNLQREALYDSLTALPNREWFGQKLKETLAKVKLNSHHQFAVLLLDLDDFKKVNDLLGHSMGDRLIVAVARRLTHRLRSFDTIARLGGDEFGIILEGLHDVDEVLKIAQRIQKDLSTPFTFDGKTIFTSCSIGVVVNSSRKTVDGIIKDADVALYTAKDNGGRCYEVFDAQIHREVVETFQLEHELRAAIAEEQLIVHYQPIIALPKQEIADFEALVRWNHPQKGTISPGQFIPIAEETGLITKIDFWVLQKVCRQLKLWQETGLYLSPITVSVNFSSRHFVLPDLIERLQVVLSEAEIEPCRIKLEITETTLIENSEIAASILKEIKALGIALSLDDFGTGYSSLSYLQQFPLDILKIDRCFVSQLNGNDGKNATIIKALIQIAHQLQLKVVAEGVETAAELAFLAENNCDSIQGYYFSPPLAISDLEQFRLEPMLIENLSAAS